MGFLMVFLAALAVLAPVLASGSTTWYWDGTVNSDWGDSGNWSDRQTPPTHQVPNSTSAVAWIDNITDSNATVNLTTGATIGGLNIDASDLLSINNGANLWLGRLDDLSDPVITNNGSIHLNSTGSWTSLRPSIGVVATLTGTGSVILNGDMHSRLDESSGDSSFLNDSSHTIRGGGTISAAVENRGNIIADNGSLFISKNITNTGGTGRMSASGSGSILQLNSGTLITGGQIDPADGLVRLSGAELINTTIEAGNLDLTQGSVLTGQTSLLGTDVTVGDGKDLILKNEGATQPTLTNTGSIHINSTGSWTSLRPLIGVVATLTGTGSVILNGDMHSRLVESAGGSSFINDTSHTIRGGGTIDAPVENRGNIIADNGSLYVSKNITNTGGTGRIGTSGSGSILQLNSGTLITGGRIDPTDGLVRLSGTELINTTIEAGNLDLTQGSVLTGQTSLLGTNVTVGDGKDLILKNDGAAQPTLTNTGSIHINSTGSWTSLRPLIGVVATLTGTGSVILNGDLHSRLVESAGGSSFINDTSHTIRGGGTIDAPVENRGSIIADNSVLRIAKPISGNGSVSVGDNAVLEVAPDLHTGTLSMTQLAGLSVAASKTIGLSGSLSFAMQDESKWIWGTGSTLSMDGGGGWQLLEIGGGDQGLAEGGFSGNFAVPRLIVSGSGTTARLVDLVDNGNRAAGASEVLYAKELTVGPGATLHLNHKVLYTHYAGSVHRVAAGEGSLFGGGTIMGPPTPVITSLSPTSGPIELEVTVSGQGFGATQGSSAVVKFNGVAATEYTSWSDTEIKCAVPATATTGLVRVTTAGGTSNGKTFRVIPAPVLTSLTPVLGPIGTEVTVAGANFRATRGTSVVKFNGVAATQYISWSDTEIKCKVPATATSGQVKVTTVGGTSNGKSFRVIPAPVLTSLTPNFGGVGTEVTIAGANFRATRGTSVVKFNGVAATQYTSWSDTEIKCKVPATTASGQVKVTTVGGTSNGKSFRVIPAPVLTLLTPNFGGVGTEVTVAGANFRATRGTSVVKFNGVAATQYTSWSDTEIKCKVPATAASGQVKVTTVGGTSNGKSFRVIPAPVLTSLTPDFGPVGTEVTVAGANFRATRGTSVVKFNGVSVKQYISWSDTQIICKVPTGATTGEVKVTTVGGTSNGNLFTVSSSRPVQNSAGPDQNVKGGVQVNLSGANSIEAARGRAASFRWRQIDGPPVILDDPQSVETWFKAPQEAPEGSSVAFELTITARDGSASTGTCIVNVMDLHGPPIADAGPHQRIVPAQIAMLDGSTSENLDAGPVTYAWKQILGSPVVLSDPASSQPLFVGPEVGAEGESLVFELTVTDADGLRSRDRCVVNVTWANDPPKASAGLNLEVKPQAVVSLDGSSSGDADGAIGSVRWTQTAGKPVKLSDPGASRPTFSVPSEGFLGEVLMFELTVMDRGGLLMKDKVAITVGGTAGAADSQN